MNYTNIPKSNLNTNSTVSVFDQYYMLPTELNNTALVAITSILESKGFESVAAETVAITILTQAKKDNVNPMELADSLKSADSDGLSDMVAEILNFYRYKSSFIGSSVAKSTPYEILRNILQ